MMVERELKLALLPKEAKQLRNHPLLADTRPRLQRYRTIYYDTPDKKLLEAGLALRIRHLATRSYLSLKAEGEGGSGFSARPEWEYLLAGQRDPAQPLQPQDLAEIADEALRTMLSRYLKELQPLFETRFTRTIWELALPQGRCELALDLGVIAAGEHHEPIAEIEMESAELTEEALYRFAHQLSQSYALWPEARSKAARGYALSSACMAPARKAAPFFWNREQTVREAFINAWRECLEQVTTNLTLYRDFGDPEAIHQLRVGLRRMRVLLRFFAPRLGRDTARSYRNRLGALARELSAARDAHVLIEDLITPCMEKLPEFAEDMKALRSYLEKHSPTKATKPNYREIGAALLEAELSWIKLEDSSPIAPFAEKRLEALRKRLLQKLDQWDAEPISAAARHEVRIALKAIRYALEWCKELMPAKIYTKQWTRAKRALTLLGAAQDWVSAQGLLAEMLKKSSARQAHLLRAAAVVLAWHHGRIIEEANAMREELRAWFSEPLSFKGV